MIGRAGRLLARHEHAHARPAWVPSSSTTRSAALPAVQDRQRSPARSSARERHAADPLPRRELDAGLGERGVERPLDRLGRGQAPRAVGAVNSSGNALRLVVLDRTELAARASVCQSCSSCQKAANASGVPGVGRTAAVAVAGEPRSRIARQHRRSTPSTMISICAGLAAGHRLAAGEVGLLPQQAQARAPRR